ncbi:unnamed protein product, partial [Rotaria sp. Silwood2]
MLVSGELNFSEKIHFFLYSFQSIDTIAPDDDQTDDNNLDYDMNNAAAHYETEDFPLDIHLKNYQTGDINDLLFESIDHQEDPDLEIASFICNSNLDKLKSKQLL